MITLVMMQHRAQKLFEAVTVINHLLKIKKLRHRRLINPPKITKLGSDTIRIQTRVLRPESTSLHHYLLILESKRLGLNFSSATKLSVSL